MGGKQDQSQNPYSMGGPTLQETNPQAWQPQPQQAQVAGPNYFDVLMDDLYQRMKARAASDSGAGMDNYTSQSEEGFSF